MLRQLWDDEAGALISAEFIVIATILVLGLVVAWAILRNAIVLKIQEQSEWVEGADFPPGPPGGFPPGNGPPFDNPPGNGNPQNPVFQSAADILGPGPDG